MPLTIPAFDQYQQPLFPLRGLWNSAPAEGDRYVNAEIDWLVTTKTTAVQFSLSGNSPVSLSQIVALAVDNGRCGVDVDFIFPDSGFVLTVPAHSQGLYTVFTNALMFYTSAALANVGDTTVIQILNSSPPPLQIAATEQQNHAVPGAIVITAGGSTTQIVAAGINGTLNAANLIVDYINGAAATVVSLNLQDGNGVNRSGPLSLPLKRSNTSARLARSPILRSRG